MNTSKHLLFAFMVLFCVPPLGEAQDAKDPASRAAALAKQAQEAFARDDHAHAIRLLKEKLTLDRDRAKASLDEAETLGMLAEVYEDVGSPKAAREPRQDALTILTTHLGKDHWRVREAQVALADVDQLAKLPYGDQRLLAQARLAEGQFSRETGGGFKARVYGVQSLCSVDASPLGALKVTGAFRVKGDPEPVLLTILAMRQSLLGKEHPHCAITLNNLAAVHFGQGDFARAEKEYTEALAIATAAWGSDHPDLANTQANLALLHQTRGDLARAQELLEKASKNLEAGLGKDHPRLVLVLNNQAGLMTAMGDFTRADLLYRRALALIVKAGADQDRDRISLLSNFAALHSLKGETKQAIALLEKAAAASKGRRDQATAYLLLNLADLRRQAGQLDEAESAAREAVKLLTPPFGESHPDHAAALHNLAMLCLEQGRIDEAEKHCRAAYAIRKTRLPPLHPTLAGSLSGLASIHAARGETKQALAAAREALDLTRRNLELTFAAQSERQQLAMAGFFRRQMDAYLSLALAAKEPGESIYLNVAPWRGMVLARQQHVRMARTLGEKSPEVAALFKEWEEIATRLTTIAWETPPAPQMALWKEKLARLSAQKEDLERRLAGLSEDFALTRRTKEQAALDRLHAILPEKTAIIDYLEYNHLEPDKDKPGKFISERRLLAFVLQPRREEIEVVPLGPAVPVTETVMEWRKTIHSRGVPSDGPKDPASRIRAAIWTPLASSLGGVETVLIAPDGALCLFPFAALPGADPAKYLVQELAIVNLPAPLHLPEIFATKKAPADDASFFLIGNVDYGPPAAETGDGARRKTWKHLSATSDETTLLQAHFNKKHKGAPSLLLEEDQATKDAVVKALASHRWVHLATHGFFDADAFKPLAKEKAATDLSLTPGPGALHPALLSGLVLSNANDHQAGVREGMLTALEVAQLDLRRVDMVTLSACSTSLGDAAQGEGLLGLQRAFHVAGARTVVSSLWDVNDAATRDLMSGMYTRLWDRKKPLSRIEALRQAQIEMLTRGAERGFVSDKHKSRLAPPAFWAAFTLSGDWR